MKDYIMTILQRIQEVGMEQFEKEVSRKDLPSNVSNDFKVLTNKVKEMLEEDLAIDNYIEKGNPIFFLWLKL